MKKYVLVLMLFLMPTGVFAQNAQEPPLSQSEYVKLLYGLDKSSAAKSNLVETIRRRGINFQLTEGLRGLTRTKSGGDLEILRTLEESARRKANPTAYQPPSAAESKSVLDKARTATLAAVEAMPDFVVKQMIQRSYSFAGTNNFRNTDRLVVAVSYRSPDVSGEKGAEEYKILSRNGIQEQIQRAKATYEEVGGTSSTGEFVTVLATIFKPENLAEFKAIDTDVIRGRRAIIYNFEISRDRKPEYIFYNRTDMTETGMSGRMWIDRENFRVLRVETNASEIPPDFPVRAARRTIDYDWVTIADEKYLLPILSDVRLTSPQDKNLFETRNLIRFKEYQKFGSEVKILDSDDEEIQEEKPNN